VDFDLLINLLVDLLVELLVDLLKLLKPYFNRENLFPNNYFAVNPVPEVTFGGGLGFAVVITGGVLEGVVIASDRYTIPL
jgi:hypothetical protein